MKPEETKRSESSLEFQKFDAALGKALMVSHDELKRREAKWKKQQKRRKSAKESRSGGTRHGR